MKIVIDMNLPPSWVGFLSKQGIEAVHWSTVGDTRASDAEIMRWAVAKGYVIFTHDLDFSTLLAVTETDGPSVIQLRSQDVLPDAVGIQVESVLRTYEKSLKDGAIITVDLVSSRVRMLPIKRDPGRGN